MPQKWVEVLRGLMDVRAALSAAGAVGSCYRWPAGALGREGPKVTLSGTFYKKIFHDEAGYKTQ